MKEEMIPEFTRRFEEYVSAHITREQMRPSLEIAAELKLSDITPALMAGLRRFNPFGPGNVKPEFITRGVRDTGTSKVVGKQLEHIKLDVTDGTTEMNCIAFGRAQEFARIQAGETFSVVYTIEENKHRAAGSPIQLFIKDIIFE